MSNNLLVYKLNTFDDLKNCVLEYHSKISNFLFTY